jgi:hypothetical protein
MTTRQRTASTSAGPTTAEEYAQQQAEEWTTYVARVPIDYYGARAYGKGDPVPASAVGDDPDAGRWVPEHLVDRIGGDTTAFAGSPTVVDPTPPTVDPTPLAAPVAGTPTPITEA